MQVFNLATKFRACYCTYFQVWACARFASDLFVEMRRGFSCFCASDGFVWWQVFYIRYCWNKGKWYLCIRKCISVSFQLCLWINATNWEVSLTHSLPLTTVHSILSWECLDFSGLDGVVFLPHCCAYPAWFAPSWKQLIQGVWSLYALLNLSNIKFGVHLFPVKKFSGEFSRKFQVYGWDERVLSSWYPCWNSCFSRHTSFNWMPDCRESLSFSSPLNVPDFLPCLIMYANEYEKHISETWNINR